MLAILLAFASEEQAEKLKRMLMRRGISVRGTVSSGAQALSMMDDLERGIIICGRSLRDMIYAQLAENMPDSFSMILIVSPERITDSVLPERVTHLPPPVKAEELIERIRAADGSGETGTGKDWKKERDRRIIERAKRLVMEQVGMDEEAAHRYLQKSAMNTGNRLVEVAEMYLMLHETS